MTADQAPGECLKPVLTREHAQAAASRLRRRDKAATAYRCIPCGGWHVGSTNGFKQPTKLIRPLHQIQTRTAP